MEKNNSEYNMAEQLMNLIETTQILRVDTTTCKSATDKMTQINE